MALSNVFLCAGDQKNRMAYRASHGDLIRSASALAMVSGDGFLVARPGAIHLGLREAVRQIVRTESRRLTGGGRSLTHSRNRSRQARFSPYPVPGLKLDLLRSVLQQRLIALGGLLTWPLKPFESTTLDLRWLSICSDSNIFEILVM
uniref:Chromosome 11 open reading frame 71 n=1 Tax=Propithecus coquereli TaxID=379532 RepID=A0A2K6F1U0_PROCO